MAAQSKKWRAPSGGRWSGRLLTMERRSAGRARRRRRRWQHVGWISTARRPPASPSPSPSPSRWPSGRRGLRQGLLSRASRRRRPPCLPACLPARPLCCRPPREEDVDAAVSPALGNARTGPRPLTLARCAMLRCMHGVGTEEGHLAAMIRRRGAEGCTGSHPEP